MASKKKESEGIALLSMYGDEDDDMDHSDNDTVMSEEESVDPAVSLGDNVLTPQPVISSVEAGRGRKKGIVDYGHDEAAMSPEPEEGELVVTGRVMVGAELQTVNETPPGSTPNTRSTPQSSDQSQSDNYRGNETECVEAVDINIEDAHKETDQLELFLPPSPMTKCSDELQEKITKFLLLKKKTGRSFNSEVRNRKEYRNPDFLLHAVTYQDIDQIGSCFSKQVFDPHGYENTDYYDEIEADLKREAERKEQEKKKNQKIDFLSNGTQAIPTPKLMPIQGVPPIAGGPVSAAVGTGIREGRPNKKSKWDKVDGDRRQDSTSSVGSALLSAGTGYITFAQQRRKEERRSSDRK